MDIYVPVIIKLNRKFISSSINYFLKKKKKKGGWWFKEFRFQNKIKQYEQPIDKFRENKDYKGWGS